MAKILRINLSSLTATTEEVPEALRKFGGRGLTASILDREVPPTCDPLGVENKLIWAPGLMGGTIAPCSGRLSVGAKSPMTKGVKEANVGGAMSQRLARLGFKAVIFEGKAKEATTVKIDKAGVSFAPAASLAGLGCYAIIEKLKSENGDKVCIACIGPAGDMKLTAASIMFTTPDFHIRVAARGGLGAVMGSKNLKSVVVDDTGLYINALNGFPGPFSAYTFKKIGCPGILRLLKGIDDRSAVFVSAVGYCDGKELLTFRGECKGIITDVMRGPEVFGYDPIFLPQGESKTFAEDDIMKDRVSHRRKSFDSFCKWFISRNE